MRDDNLNDDPIYQELKAKFGKEDITDPKKLFNFLSSFFLKDVSDTKLLDVYQKLENELELDFTFELGENLSDLVKNDRLMFFFQEFTESLLNLIFITLNQDKIINKINDDYLKGIAILSNKLRNRQILMSYVIEFETQYNLQIKPIFLKLKEKNILPMGVPGKGQQYEINCVKNFLKHNDDFQLLEPLFQSLDAYLRNSIVHLDYYIDNENNCTYYDRRHNPNPLSLSIQEIYEKIMRLFLTKLVFMIRLGLKL